LDAIFGEASAPPPTAPEATAPSATLPSDTADLVQAALESYQTGQQALQQGDWQRYGEAQQQLENILQQLNQQNP
ncbi:hypothetical protein C8B47_14645, partial [filamentous cyanobacterium CCP4]